MATEKKPRTPAQIAATEKLKAANAAKRAATTTAPDPEQIHKVIGGDWGNNYGRIKNDEAGQPTVSVELIGQDITIDVDRADLVAVPFIGA